MSERKRGPASGPLKTASAGGVVIKAGRVLLCFTRYPEERWTLPKGIVEPGEEGGGDRPAAGNYSKHGPHHCVERWGREDVGRPRLGTPGGMVSRC